MKNNFFYPLKAIFVGLVISQALATLHVYLSNIELYKITAAINKAGYLAIPNKQVASSLPEIGPAFLGGLFLHLPSESVCLLYLFRLPGFGTAFCPVKSFFLLYFLSSGRPASGLLTAAGSVQRRRPTFFSYLRQSL